MLIIFTISHTRHDIDILIADSVTKLGQRRIMVYVRSFQSSSNFFRKLPETIF